MTSQLQKQGLTCRLLTDFAELRLLAGEWERLWRANPHREVFGKFSWIESWWRGYGARAQLVTPAVFQDGKCIGILPLVIQERELRFVGHPATDYNDLICDPGMAADVLGAAITALDESPFPWDSCKLDNVPETSLIVRACHELPLALRRRTELSVSALCPTVLLDEGRAETLKGILGKVTVSQMLRKLQKLGALTFRHIEDRIEAREHLPSFYRQQIRCRALAGIRSQLLDQESRDFYSALVDNLDPRNEVRFSVLELAGRPIAYNFGFQLDGKFVHYTPTFDVDLFDLSPGQVLLRFLFLYVQEHDIREFDFTVGDESYKSRYANHTKRNFVLVLYPRTATGRIAHAVHAAQERLRAYPSLYRAVKNTTSAVGASAGRIARIVRRDGLPRIARKIAEQLFCAAIYARDEVLVFTLIDRDIAPFAPGLTFRAATLSDFADAVASYPEFFGDDTLHDLRKRMKSGYKPFVVLDNGNVVHTLWYRVDDRIVSSELGEDFVFALGKPVGIIFDARTPPAARGRGIYPKAMSLIGQEIRRSGLEPWAYVRLDNAASRRGLEKTGIKVVNRMIRYDWFHWIRRRVIQ